MLAKTPPKHNTPKTRKIGKKIFDLIDLIDAFDAASASNLCIINIAFFHRYENVILALQRKQLKLHLWKIRRQERFAVRQ